MLARRAHPTGARAMRWLPRRLAPSRLARSPEPQARVPSSGQRHSGAQQLLCQQSTRPIASPAKGRARPVPPRAPQPARALSPNGSKPYAAAADRNCRRRPELDVHRVADQGQAHGARDHLGRRGRPRRHHARFRLRRHVRICLTRPPQPRACVDLGCPLCWSSLSASRCGFVSPAQPCAEVTL